MKDKIKNIEINGLAYNPNLIIIQNNGFQDIFNYTEIKLETEIISKNKTLLAEIVPNYNEFNSDRLSIEINRKYMEKILDDILSNYPSVFEKMIKAPLIDLENKTDAQIIILLFIGDHEHDQYFYSLENSKIKIINVRDRLMDQTQEEIILRSVDFHPNEKAYEILSEMLYVEIREKYIK